MSMCLATHGLRHDVGGRTVLDGVELRVPDGAIYGFLGPNGAGKTTTLRIVLGLLAPRAGHVALFGLDPARQRIAALRAVGAMIETPSFYAHLSARANLRLLQAVHRCAASRVDDVLEEVGLAAAADRRAGEFSLGMKQRLGLAIALLHGPRLLVLDEPSNGLDPAGMVEMRALLQALNRRCGTTVLVSSHVLSEVDRLATHVGVLHGGRLVFQGPIARMRDIGGMATTVLRTSDDAHACDVLARQGHRPCRESGRVRLPALDDAARAAVNRLLLSAGMEVHELRPMGGDLETVYMGLLEAHA